MFWFPTRSRFLWLWYLSSEGTRLLRLKKKLFWLSIIHLKQQIILRLDSTNNSHTYHIWKKNTKTQFKAEASNASLSRTFFVGLIKELAFIHQTWNPFFVPAAQFIRVVPTQLSHFLIKYTMIRPIKCTYSLKSRLQGEAARYQDHE